ncbi:MAG TPA: DUF4893 domain-containing protein [Sphingomicrobium sp.]|nr:DUF4893 domain-containing protein [Sphingomicrobium sp.]
MRLFFHSLFPVSLLVACSASAVAQPQASDDWRQVATAADKARMDRYDQAWTEGLRGAQRANPALLRRLGAVARRGGALSRPQPTPANYRCRTIKLGGNMGIVAYGWFRCRVTLSPGGDLALTKVTGSQRPSGKLYPLNGRQLVFLGTVALGGERSGPAYGKVGERDLIGKFERIGGTRYRLVMPKPAFESDLDIFEVVR